MRTASCSAAGGFVEVVHIQQVVYVSCTGAIWTTTDAIAVSPAWVSEGSLPDPIPYDSLHDANAEGVILASDEDRLWRRDPNGTWSIEFVGSGTQSVGAPAMLGDTAYFTYKSPTAGTYIYWSSDAGQSWSVHTWLPAESLFAWDALVDPRDPDRVYFGEYSGLRILDGTTLHGPYGFNGRDPQGEANPVVGAMARMPDGELLTGGCVDVDDPSTSWPLRRFQAAVYSSVASGTGKNSCTYNVAATADGRAYFVTSYGSGGLLYGGQVGGAMTNIGPLGSVVLSVDAPYSTAGPAVVVLHGWNGNCSGLETLRQNLASLLVVGEERVQCFEGGPGDTANGYDERKGAITNAHHLQWALRAFREELDMAPEEPVHLVAHSFGGLVARYYLEEVRQSTDGPIGSVSLLGTPNRGASPAGFVSGFCVTAWTVCRLFELAGGPSLTGDDTHDMNLGSEVIATLSANDPLEGVAYRSEAGTQGSFGADRYYREENDCIVPLSSAAADFITESYNVSHTLASGWGCDSPSLTTDATVAQKVTDTILGVRVGGSTTSYPEGAGQPREKGVFTAVLTAGAPSATASSNIGQGERPVTFAAFWPPLPGGSSLSLAVTRPNGQPLIAGPGVSHQVFADPAIDNLVGEFWAVDTPEQGTWQVTASGTSPPATGVPIYASTFVDSDVVAVASTDAALYPVNSPMVIRSSLVDNGVRVTASSASATVTPPNGGAPTTMQLTDPNSDEVYTGTYQLGVCGFYGVSVTMTGATTESPPGGTTTRMTTLTPAATVPNDRIGDHCDDDEDNDGRKDQQELTIDGTDPFAADTDLDGCRDAAEIQTAPGTQGTGGLRDPLDFWDFMTVPTGSPLRRDGFVSAADIAGVVSRFGSNDTGAGAFYRDSDPLSMPNPYVQPSGSRQNYHPAYDRGGSRFLEAVWNLLPADGSITAGDLAAVVAQFGNNCG